MKKLLLITLAIITLTSFVYSQERPIERGGYIVYEKDGHGLVAAPTDLGTYYWDYAKKYSDTLTLNGYSDWRLPSKEELNSLYENRDKIGGFGDGIYWSCDDDSTHAWVQSFDNGEQHNYYKYGDFTSYGVRAVRAF